MREKAVIEYLTEKGAMIDKKALDVLSTRENFTELIDELLKEKFFIDAESLNNLIIRKETKLGSLESKVIVKKGTERIEKKTSANFKILKEFDITGQSFSEGKIQDFLNFFKDKFEFLEKVLKKRQGFQAKPISRIDKTVKGREVHVIGMVQDKQITKNGHLILKVEDLEAQCTALVLKDDSKNMQAGRAILNDEVIGLKAVKGSGDLLIVKEIILPDLTQRSTKRSVEDVEIAVISDVHAGSKHFLENEFNKFLQWINGNLGEGKELEKVQKIKYLFVLGDNVDGIGVYPEQFDELAVRDIFEQYEIFSSFIEKIPEHIQVFIIPGQHDAVRWADPQPAIPKEFVPRLYELSNVHLLGNPSWVEVEGLKFLLYHGASLHELYSQVSGLDPSKPELAIIEVLKRRDLMTGYGTKQPYAPENKNFLLVRMEPDVYLGGEMHHNGYGSYKGTAIINAGTWQNQTKYQISLGRVATPCIVPVMNLKTGKITENFFKSESEESA